MAWKIDLTASAAKQLDKLGHVEAKRITTFLRHRLASRDDPREIGKALKGSQHGELWRYRVGDYRIVASIEDANIRILVVRIAHRREVYRD